MTHLCTLTERGQVHLCHQRHVVLQCPTPCCHLLCLLCMLCTHCCLLCLLWCMLCTLWLL